MKVKLVVEGGKMAPGPAVAQQLGPMGINLGKVIADVNTATAGFAGMKVPVELDVDPKSKTYTVAVLSPPVAELIKKEIGIAKGSGAAGATKVGNISIERIISIAKMKQDALLAKDLKAAVKLVVGTCVSLGVLVDNKHGRDIERDIEAGVYDNEIKNEITELANEKKQRLASHFAQVVSAQERTKKAAEEAKAAAEAAKVAADAAAAAAGTPAPAAAAGAKAGEKAPAAAKAGEKAPAAAKAAPAKKK